MRIFRSARWILMALLLSLVPASSFAGVFISVGFAPPVLPVYEQPPCPEPGWMWTPGYWAYGDDGYYWVPGAWVPAPYEGALWTPGYWGWSGGLYVWHGGYWGRHVGYYGGVNYGFGYMGMGFAGGMWRGHDFVYNTAVVHVNERVIHNTYVDRTVVERNTIVNDRHVAFSGGPGGINHPPTGDERVAMHEQHVAPTSFQSQHINAARNDHSSYFKANGGHPQTMAVARPLGSENHGGPSAYRGGPQASVNTRGSAGAGVQPRPQYGSQGRPGGEGQPRSQGQPQGQPRNEGRPAPQYQPRNDSRPAPQSQPRNESRPTPQARPESRPAPQERPQHEQARPQHEDHRQ
jgi:WXXGXW repeat (2 copies)